jgi:ABC-type Mn2+/Zn2+ transport system ATPase subunit
MIELINFAKRYGDLLAVDHLNLKIEPGEMFGFIGPNGAGKSTTIRFLATLLKATGGDGIVNGHRVSREPLAVRRSVGYMPDAFGVYDGMKVWEFLDFFAVAYQIPRARRKQVIGDVLDLLDLTGKRDAFVSGLSRGMKQRLAADPVAVDDAVAAGRLQQRGQEADRGALAGSVGPDEPEHLARLDLQVQVVDRQQVAVPLGEVDEFDHESCNSQNIVGRVSRPV